MRFLAWGFLFVCVRRYWRVAESEWAHEVLGLSGPCGAASFAGMLNYIWAYLMMLGLLVAGLVGKLSGEGNVISEAFEAAKYAVMGIALPLAGMMMFWMGT